MPGKGEPVVSTAAGRGAKGTLMHPWWECELVQPLTENSVEISPKIKDITAVPLLGIY